MKKFISEYIKTCPECNRYKPTNQKLAGLLRTPAYPQRFETLAIDLFGPLPETSLARKITQDIIPVYHSQANSSERKNRHLKPRLAILVGEEHAAWEDKLPLIRFAINTSVRDTTGHTAAYLQFGRQVRTSDDIRHDIRQVIDKDNFVPEITPYLKRFANSTLDVKHRVEQKQEYPKENFDRRQRRKYYKPGDKVWMTIHPISRNNRSRKFMPKREGPYLILTLRSPVTYEIADPANPDQALGTYHVSSLKNYEEPETERNTGFVAPLRKRGRLKLNYLLIPSQDVNGTRQGVCNKRFNSKTEM
ncbi:transposon Tf2-9 polyprotein [Trichonephila clavipes]|nr:transposon Tf2-9 polyprotein [Trichonephila clavipes]